ncbi:hypothetical protein I316_05610 [Kwoniella heveanensis BCC8398]|uniref:Uncharacterized protein n=1 Tax=Kwoniella heveanensis BCC8398 TaxID=1296120 RepID=A0A1B9GNL6_9TREE|nr:hypothetical protein I316_05610 [Kwoniella heveanensis BCC8398]
MDVAALEEITHYIMEPNPYLQYQPAFAYTLPIQLLVNGITITLLCVLLIHLLFTTQYHYPLAPLNYILQLLSILVVTISVIIKIVVILQHSAHSADIWPFDLDYVAVTIPPASWGTGRCAAWFLLQALNNGLSNITHIQFLTMLYPSRIEARLIMFVLGPLAIASSALVFSALSPHQTVLDISDAIRNVFNSTLLLIFTISLVIWGFFVNRRRAWRSDGGTAVFGIGSLFLAAISTSFNFVAVAEDGIDWLQHLLFAAVLWQVWLGWWWWVGSGMGIGEVEDIMERAERKKRKQAKAAARARQAGAHNSRNDASSAANRIRATSLSGMADGISTGVTSILRSSRAAAGTLTRRNTAREGDDHLAEQGAIELSPMGANATGGARERDNVGSAGRDRESGGHHVEFDRSATLGTGEESLSRGRGGQSTTSETSSTSATPSLHPPRTLGQLLSFPTTLLVIYLRRLRKAHEEATKQQALARAERRQRVFHEAGAVAGVGGGGETSNSARFERGVVLGGDEDVGWGLGRFGIKEHEESARRLRAAGERLNEERLLGRSTGNDGTGDEGEAGDGNGIGNGIGGDVGVGSRERSPEGSRSHSRERETAVQADEQDGADRAGDTGRPTPSGPSTSVRHSEQAEAPTPAAARGTGTAADEGEWEDVESSNDSSEDRIRRRNERRRGGRGEGATTTQDDGRRRQREGRGGGWSWWGPLREWRLNDRSVF